MKKRIVSLIISICFIFGSLAPCYAADGSSTSPYFVKPESGSFSRYYLGSSGTTYTTANYTTWGNIFQALTQTIAQSIGQLSTNVVNKLTTIDGRVDGLEGYVDNLESYVDGLESKIDTANVHLDSIEDYTGDTYSLLGQIRTIVNSISQYMPTISGYIDGIEGYIDTVESKLSDVYNAITNSSTDLGTLIPYFMPDSSYDFSNNSWKQYVRRVIGTDITFSNSTVTSSSLAVQLRDYLYDSLLIQGRSTLRLEGLVMGDSYSDQYYNKSFVMSSGNEQNLGTQSIWADIRKVSRYITQFGYRTTGDPLNNGVITKYDNSSINVDRTLTLKQYMYLLGENITSSLGRLAFVLANDQDIALRNNTSNNVSQFNYTFASSNSNASVGVNDFVSLGSVSGSLKSSFSSNGTISDISSSLSNSDDGRWDWFSINTFYDLDSTGQNARNNVKSYIEFTDFYSDRLVIFK